MNAEHGRQAAAFALLGHPESYAHLAEILLRSRPDYSPEKLHRHQATLAKFFEWTPVYVSEAPVTIPRDDNRALSGRLIVCTFLPQALASPPQMLAAYAKTREGCRLAKQLGARVVGLGGFTAIAGGAPGEALAEEFDIAVTSGNLLTAALALAQLDALLERLGWRLKGRTVAVLGATGDIGRACALALARRADRLTLIARNQARLNALREALPSEAAVHTSTDAAAALEASVILAATSSPHPLLSESDLRPGTVVCDIGYPKNLSEASNPRRDALIFSGGLAEMPFGLDIMRYTRLPAPNVMYGCFSETMLMAMTGKYEIYPPGQRGSTVEGMEEILTLARTRGFRPAPWYRGNRLIDDEAIDGFLAGRN